MHVSTVLLVITTVLSVVCADSSYLLPQDITPTPNTYTLWLSPDLDQRVFEGNLSLTITTKANVNSTITLHSSNITIRSIEVLSPDGDDIFESYELDDIREFLILKLTNDTLPNQNYTINILYQGSLQDDMKGFYISTYTTEDGTVRDIAATQFAPTDARKAFPCFDEPRYKATFKITIKTPAGYHSLANTIPLSGCDFDDTVGCDFVFEETPVMSTYLVAFVVSDFHYYYTFENDILYRSLARPNAMAGLTYSISVSPGMLIAMGEYVDFPFLNHGLKKLDQVALPDFSAGAMENWGLITYRETALLYREGVNTASNKQRVATVIAHEIAHAWFGNLVTTEWWDSTWLNEGFASLFEYYVASKVETDWRLMDQFVVEVQQAVFSSDAFTSAHALTAECYTPSQIIGMFSTITYSKGASVLRMWSHSLTEEVFQTALRTYQVARQFDTATPSQLFSHIQTQAQANSSLPAHVNIQFMLRSWTEQPGFPVVNVERNYNNRTAIITQHRFLLSPETNTSEVLLWKIPINWATESSGFEDTKPIAWLTGLDDIISTGLPEANEWVIFNVQETGYYRVNYDADNWNLIIAALLSNHLVIHPLNRAQLLDDSLNLARAGELDYDTALRLTAYLKNELDYIPWYSALSAFTILDRRFNAEHEDYPYFTRYILELVDKVYSDLGFEDSNSHIEKLHRNVILNWACRMGHVACNENSNAKFKNFVENNVVVPPDLQSVVYCVGLRNSGYAEWEFLWNRFINSLDFSEQAILISALGCTTNTTTLAAYLQKSIDGVYVRMQDGASVFSAVFGNRIGVTVALEFLENNFAEIQAYYGSMGSISNIVQGIAARISTEEQRDKLVAFVDKYSESLGSAGSAAIQTVEENLSWTSTHQDSIFTYLKSAFTPAPGTSESTAGTTDASVTPTTAPPVETTPTPSVETTPAPPVETTPTPSVETTPAPPVETTPTPPVETTSAPPVEITPTTPVEITTPGAAPHFSPYGSTILLALLTTILLQFR